MNKERRERLAKLESQIPDIISELEAARDEEQESYDNLPESVQQGDKGDKMQTAIDNLESAISYLESAQSDIENARE